VIPENRIEDRADHRGPANGTSSISADVDRYLVEIRDLVIGKQDADLGRGCGVVFGHTGQSAREFRTRYIPECRMAVTIKSSPLSSRARTSRLLRARAHCYAQPRRTAVDLNGRFSMLIRYSDEGRIACSACFAGRLACLEKRDTF
jgi:hypothetical protein